MTQDIAVIDDARDRDEVRASLDQSVRRARMAADQIDAFADSVEADLIVTATDMDAEHDDEDTES